MPVHRMHLRGPWEYEIVGDATSAPNAIPQTKGTVRLPATWAEAFGDFRGTVRFLRRFHTPTNLDPHEKVFVIFGWIGASAIVSLNGQLLGTIPDSATTAEFEITPFLAPNNE